MRKAMLSSIALCFLVSAAAAKKARIPLALDYTQRPDWAFVMNYNAERTIVDGDSTSRARTQIRCSMSAKLKKVYEGQRLAFVIDSVRIESSLYNQEQQQSIAAKLTGADFSLGIINGCPVFDTLRTFSVSEISRWDFVLQFAKLLPDLPAQPVSRGYTWERSGVYPVSTTVGEVPCDIYRLYSIDSVAADTSRVCISWQFRYAASERAVEQSSVLKKVPVSGKGMGTAVIDAKRKVLLEANMRFETPPASYGGKKIQWVEKTSLKPADKALPQ